MKSLSFARGSAQCDRRGVTFGRLALGVLPAAALLKRPFEALALTRPDLRS